MKEKAKNVSLSNQPLNRSQVSFPKRLQIKKGAKKMHPVQILRVKAHRSKRLKKNKKGS